MCELQGHWAASLPRSVTYLLADPGLFIPPTHTPSAASPSPGQSLFSSTVGRVLLLQDILTVPTEGNEASFELKTCSTQALTSNLTAHRDFAMV